LQGLSNYLILINGLTLGIYALDKLLAKMRSWRVPEIVRLFLAVIGGSMGAYLAMYIFRHKTLHWKFKIGIPIIMILQVVAFMFFR